MDDMWPVVPVDAAETGDRGTVPDGMRVSRNVDKKHARRAVDRKVIVGTADRAFVPPHAQLLAEAERVPEGATLTRAHDHQYASPGVLQLVRSSAWAFSWRLRRDWVPLYPLRWSFGQGNGDGTLFFPGTPRGAGGGPAIGGRHGIPIESIRLKRIRDGREDYEYLRILAERGLRPAAMKLVRRLFGPPAVAMHNTTVDPAALNEARSELVGMITGAMHRPRGAD